MSVGFSDTATMKTADVFWFTVAGTHYSCCIEEISALGRVHTASRPQDWVLLMLIQSTCNSCHTLVESIS
jgi:hypothetical protein